MDRLSLGDVEYVYNPFLYFVPSRDVKLCELLFSNIVCVPREIAITLYSILKPDSFDKSKNVILENYKKQTGLSVQNICAVASTYLDASLYDIFKSKLVDC